MKLSDGCSRLMRQVAWHIVPVLAALGTFVLCKEIDTRLFPVISEFRITKVVPAAVSTIIEGTLRKKRDCSFLGVDAYMDGSDAKMDVTFLDVTDGNPRRSRAVRLQVWGPWEVDTGKAKSIKLVARHSCHILWDHTTQLTAFIVPKFRGSDAIPIPTQP